MSLLLPRPVTVPAADGEAYYLNLDYEAHLLPGFVLAIKAGYRFDGASIPRIFWCTTGTPMSPQFQAASLIHDALYDAELLDRRQADGILYWCLRQDGVYWYTARKMWLGVRLGGYFVWANHSPESISWARQYATLRPATGAADATHRADAPVA